MEEKIDTKKELGITTEEVSSVQETMFHLMEQGHTTLEMVHFIVNMMKDNPRTYLAIVINYVLISEFFMNHATLSEEDLAEMTEKIQGALN